MISPCKSWPRLSITERAKYTVDKGRSIAVASDFDLTLNYRPRLPQRRDYKIGCIGAGFIMADCHLVAYREAGIQPVAIASRTAANARQVAQRHEIPKVYAHYEELLADREIEVLDVAVPPDIQPQVIAAAVAQRDHIRGILAQKPLAGSYLQAKQVVEQCRAAGITLAVNQNMRYDQSIRACKDLLDRGVLGEPVLATFDMRAIPHWMPWQQEQGWVTLRIMSIHHLDTFRYWFGDPQRVFASARPDPRTARSFAHEDGICLYILEYENGLRAMSCDDVWTGPAQEGAAGDIGITYRVEGLEGLARGTIGWPAYPARQASTLDFSTLQQPGYWLQPRWNEVWFPDAFLGPMAELLCALEEGVEPNLCGSDNLHTMAVVDACYRSVAEHRAIELSEILDA